MRVHKSSEEIKTYRVVMSLLTAFDMLSGHKKNCFFVCVLKDKLFMPEDELNWTDGKNIVMISSLKWD